LCEHRAAIETARTQKTVDAVEYADVLAGAVRGIHLVIVEVDNTIADARYRLPIIIDTLTRRIHAAATVAVETKVAWVGARLRELKAQTERIHAIAEHSDDVLATILAGAHLLQLSELALPRVTMPRWSSAQSKASKGNWVGDVFAVPELE
jgi:hypothetical protein